MIWSNRFFFPLQHSPMNLLIHIVELVLFQTKMQLYELVNPYDLIQSIIFHTIAESYEPLNPYDLVQSFFFTPSVVI